MIKEVQMKKVILSNSLVSGTVIFLLFVAEIVQAASPFPAPPIGGILQCQAKAEECEATKQTFPATGQTRCFGVLPSDPPPQSCEGTGQDGEIQAGILSYTDNGNGTITDNSTKLEWEKKTDDGSIHDINRNYTWAEAFEFIDQLNAENYAGHSDWRLPNIKELFSIVYFAGSSPDFYGSPMIHPTFGPTAQSHYWSSTSFPFTGSAPTAYAVNFLNGWILPVYKGDSALEHVRAVRGGL